MFRAYDATGERLVAVKLFRLDLPPERVHQLVAALEKLIAADLVHPAIATPIAAGMVGVSAYLAMDYAAAESLDLAVREYGPAPPGDAVRVAAQLAGAIDFAAVVNISHGAMHPRDVLLSADDTRLTGFGIARALEQAGVTAPIRRPYTAPERIGGGAWDRRADVFSLAALTHELLWGRRIAGAGQGVADGLADPPGADSEALRNVFAQALADDPAERFATALEFADALRAAFPDVPETIATAPEPAATPAEPSRLPLEPVPVPVSEPVVMREDVDRHAVAAPVFVEPVTVAPIAPPASMPAAAPATVADPHGLDLRPAESVRHRDVETTRKRSNLAPTLAVAAALVVGVAVGYGVGMRSRTEPAADTTPATATPAPAPASATPVPASLPPGPPGPPRPPAAPAPAALPPAATPPGTAREATEVAVAPASPKPVERTPASRPPATESANTADRRALQNRAPTPSPRPPDRPAEPRPGASLASGTAGRFIGRLSVDSRPDGARVYLDGRLVGTTPLDIPTVSAGEHAVRLERDGYRRWSSAIRVVATERTRVTASLER